MHVHLPKPLHGWRQFVGEVGIIVVGVLIALAAEQMVSWLHERESVAQVRMALDGELAEDRARWDQINSQDKCARQRLDTLERWIGSAPAGASVADGYNFITWNMHSSAWDIAKSSPSAAHIPLDKRLIYASLYAALDNWRELLGIEGTNSEQLTSLLATADQPANRIQIRMRIIDARRLVNERDRLYPYVAKRFDELGIKSDPSQLNGPLDASALCKPLEVIPSPTASGTRAAGELPREYRARTA
jgi:hypothetical protein